MKVIEFDEKCKSCEGTGLYIGVAERDGSAVVCLTCKGTGCHHYKYEYEDFTGRSGRPNVKRVYEVNPGICIGEGNVHKLTDFGGIPYDAWLRGEKFTKGTENRKFTCPAWWFQSANYKEKPHWDECDIFGLFSRCEHFHSKEKCWKRFDIETGAR